MAIDASVDISREEAVRLIKAHPDPSTPFFLYLAFHGVHTPLEAPAHYISPYDGLIDDRDRKVMGGTFLIFAHLIPDVPVLASSTFILPFHLLISFVRKHRPGAYEVSI